MRKYFGCGLVRGTARRSFDPVTLFDQCHTFDGRDKACHCPPYQILGQKLPDLRPVFRDFPGQTFGGASRGLTARNIISRERVINNYILFIIHFSHRPDFFLLFTRLLNLAGLLYATLQCMILTLFVRLPNPNKLDGNFSAISNSLPELPVSGCSTIFNPFPISRSFIC